LKLGIPLRKNRYARLSGHEIDAVRLHGFTQSSAFAWLRPGSGATLQPFHRWTMLVPRANRNPIIGMIAGELDSSQFLRWRSQPVDAFQCIARH